VRVVPSGAQLASDLRKLADEDQLDYAVIERGSPIRSLGFAHPLNLGKVVLENDPAKQLAAHAGTMSSPCSPRRTSALRRNAVRSWSASKGEFNFAVLPGDARETLRQLVTRVGGVTPQAYLFGAELTPSRRARTRKNASSSHPAVRAGPPARRGHTRAQCHQRRRRGVVESGGRGSQAMVARLRTLNLRDNCLELPENASPLISPTSH